MGFQRNVRAFLKMITKKIDLKKSGSTKEQNLLECLKTFAGQEEFKFTLQ